MSSFRYLILFTAVFSLSPAAMAITGLQIMQERERRHERSFEESWVEMRLYDKKNRQKKSRVMVTWSMEEPSTKLDRRLIKFAAPADIRGTGLMLWEQPSPKEDDQWLYLPASKKVKRIAGSGKRNQFVGTDLAFEDLRRENLAAHAYELSGETTIDGAKCWIVTATPSSASEKKNSGYSKRVLYIRKDIYFTVKSEYYGRRGRLEKVATCQKVVKVAGKAWRSDLVTVTRVKPGTKTVLIHQRRKLDQPIDASLFTQQGLKRPMANR